MLRQESAVQSWAAAQGYPAPEVLTVLAPGEALPSPVQLMTRIPGVIELACANRDPRAFLEPDVLDLNRSALPHQAFGFGPY